MLVVSPAIRKTFTAISTYNTDKARACHVVCCLWLAVSSADLCYRSLLSNSSCFFNYQDDRRKPMKSKQMWDIGRNLICSAFRIFFKIFLGECFCSDWFSYRSNPNARKKCPVSTTDLKDMYDGLVKHMSAGAKTDFWVGQKPRRNAFALYLSTAKFRLQNQLKNRFYLPDKDQLNLNGRVLMNQKEPGEVQIFYRLTAEDLAAYKSLTNRSEFITTCKSRYSCQKLQELLALDHRYLIICV